MNIDNLFNVSGKTAVVTGGSRGIGEMITAGFLANGTKVYITARKAPALIEKAKELSELYGSECVAIPCDLSTLEGIESFTQQIKEKFSSLTSRIWSKNKSDLTFRNIMDADINDFGYLTWFN